MLERLAALVLVLFAPAVATSTSELESFRGVYGVWNYSLLGELGFDAVYQEVWWTLGADAALAKFANESVLAHAHNLSYVCGPYFEVTTPPFDYERAVTAFGHVERGTPSRVDPLYWQRLIDEPGAAIANLSLTHPIWGIVWDMEDYLREEFTYWDYTFDELAISMYANETGHDVPRLIPGERTNWFRSRGLLEDFQHWQEERVYEMARATRERIRAINPEINLGILAFEDDSWFHLSILLGFSTEQMPVSAWHEDTYSGYKLGKIEHNHAVFADLGINGKVVPGLWSLWLAPFDLLNHMEFAARHNGAYWIYQRATNPWVLGTEEDYVLIFQLLHRYVEFNGTSAPKPLPASYIYPGVDIRFNLGPEGLAGILDAGRAFDLGLAFRDLELLAADGYWYLSHNLSLIERVDPTLRFEDLPCFVYGLAEEDFEATFAWSMIRELQDLVSIYNSLNFGRIPAVEQALDTSIVRFQAASYLEAREIAGIAIETAYAMVFADVWPYVEAQLANPRNTSVPLPILNRVYNAKRLLEQGQEAEGRMYLLNAMKQWSEIPEGSLPALAPLSSAALLGSAWLSRGRTPPWRRRSP